MGKIVKVHKNGRINYEGQMTEADGHDFMAEHALEASRMLDQAALQDEIEKQRLAVENGVEGNIT